jgi:hypothetical protein
VSEGLFQSNLSAAKAAIRLYGMMRQTWREIKMSIQEPHEKALNLAKKFKQAESDLIEIFQVLDLAKAFMKLGYASLFEYGVKALGLSEANTYAFIQVARAAREVPALKTAIQYGRALGTQGWGFGRAFRKTEASSGSCKSEDARRRIT